MEREDILYKFQRYRRRQHEGYIGNSQLTEKDVERIRKLHLRLKGRYGLNVKLARKFNVHRNTISGIVTNKTWKQTTVNSREQ